VKYYGSNPLAESSIIDAGIHNGVLTSGSCDEIFLTLISGDDDGGGGGGGLT
jgi:hypothetical protein